MDRIGFFHSFVGAIWGKILDFWHEALHTSFHNAFSVRVFLAFLLLFYQLDRSRYVQCSSVITRARLFYLTLLFSQLDRSQYSLDALQINMQTRNMKRKTLESKQDSQTEKPKFEEVFPIETFIQNPGYWMISRNIFKYLKLKDFSNCCLVSKGWKQFLDDDKYLANVQLTEVVSLYSKGNYIGGYSPFHFVCHNGSLRIVKLFLDNKKKLDIDVNARDDNGCTPLHFANEFNNALVVKELLNHGLDVTLRSKQNTHLIHSAAMNKDPKVIQAVFESRQLTNIDKNATNCNGHTVFHFAAQNEHYHEPLAYLLTNAMKFNLNINQLDNYQGNVFHSACGFGTEETVKFLIQNAKKHNIDLNLRDISGYTPFHYACYYGKLQIVEILLKNSKEHKINVVSVNNNGKDGQAYAEQKGHTDIVKLIKEWKKRQSNEVTSYIQDEILFQLKRIKESGDSSIANHAIKLMTELKENTN